MVMSNSTGVHMNDIKMTGIEPETFDRIKKNISNLLPSSPTDDGTEKGPTNVELYNQIYGNRDITDSAKGNKISALRRGDGISLNDIIKIAAWKGLSLDWFILGKEQTTETPPTVQEGAVMPKVRLLKLQKSKEGSERFLEKARKAKRQSEARNYISQLQDGDDLSILSLANSLLLDVEKAPIMQMSAGILHLFNYANISIVGSYDEYNFALPQSLTIKISPKNLTTCGTPKLSDNGYKISWDFDEEPDDNIHDYTFWDIRAALVQRLLVIACKSLESNTFDPFVILKSNLIEMYNEYVEIGPGLLFLSPPDNNLFTPDDERFGPLFKRRLFDALENDELYSDYTNYDYHDPMRYIRSCLTDEVPADVE